MQWFYSTNFKYLKGDFFGGVTAAIVALPLALAFGVSSGAGAIAGLYGAIAVGFFAAIFGGTPSQVSGPTGPMTVVIAGIFSHYILMDPISGPTLAFTVVMLGGLFQILFGLFRLGQFITLMPFPVISGFMNGIGTIIIILQLAPLLGGDSIPTVLGVVQALPELIHEINITSFFLGCITLVVVFLCPRSLGRWIPSPLLALVIGTLLSTQLNEVNVIGSIPTGLPTLHWPVFDLSLLDDMIISALMLATLGSIDSLLTSLVADNMTRSQHHSDKELVGQGIGNIVAGFVGGLPGAGATMRTVVNIRAGGKTPISGATHALVLLVIVLGAGSIAESIPLAVLSGILIKVGIDIIDWRFLARVYQAPVFVIFLMMLVWGLTVFVDLITAVAVGVFLANIYTVKRLSDTQVQSVKVIQDDPRLHEGLTTQESQLLQEAKGRILLYQLNGPLTYAAAKGISNKLLVCKTHEVLLLDFSNVPHIDVSTAIALEEVILDTKLAGQTAYLVGANPAVEGLLRRLKILSQVPAEQRIPDRLAALKDASKSLS